MPSMGSNTLGVDSYESHVVAPTTTYNLDDATKGNRRAKMVYREIPKGSVYELVELLKDKIVLGPGPAHKGARRVERMDEEWSAIPTGNVRLLADFLKDKIPMVFPGSKKETEAPIKPSLSFADMLVDRIPNLKSPSRESKAVFRRSTSDIASSSVNDLAFLLKDKIHMRSSVEEDERSASECKENCKCCREMTKLLALLETVVGSRVVVQLKEKVASSQQRDHRDDESFTSSSSSGLECADNEHTLVIPKRKDGRTARVCSLVWDEEPTRLPNQPVTRPPTPIPTPTALPIGATPQHVTPEPFVSTPMAKPVPSWQQQSSTVPSWQETSSTVPSWQETSPTPTVPSWQQTSPSPKAPCDDSSACTDPTGDDTSRSSLCKDDATHTTYAMDQSDRDDSDELVTSPSWSSAEEELEKHRLRTEYVLTSRKLRSNRDSALHYSMSSERTPWDRSKYGNWRQQQKQSDRTKQRAWS